ncbi:MAG: flagellar M-ring protein FliF C-terminal domain-containing protein [Acidocella sp.]|nr:flagellar M-ring protein FliF C-terminal domain-containing protein [Acidocella sp.]
MLAWRAYLAQFRDQASRLPKSLWLAGAVILLSLGAALWLEMSGPPYAVLDEGLSPADGGKVIAALQKLGIPYQLQEAGNLILVPAPSLAQARLQLGTAQVPGSDVTAAWDRLETAPMTASDLAQSTMAMQALELSLQQSIQSMAGIRSADVFLAIPRETPFLGDQPKPTASVVIDADATSAQTQGPAIANLVAGAVPGLSAAQVTVETTAGIAVYPTGNAMAIGTQMSTVAEVEASARARLDGLLTPLVGAGNFQTDISADIDFTREHIHQISYGPTHLVAHQTSALSTQWGTPPLAIGIPGALSNEPPAPTSASTATPPAAGAGASAVKQTPAPAGPTQNTSNLDQRFVTDQSDADITDPDWHVKSLAVSVVLNQAAMNGVTQAQVKSVIAGAFAYPQVNVTVVSANFHMQPSAVVSGSILQAVNPLTHALLELLAAAALLFGLAVPAGRRLAGINIQSLLPPPQRPMPMVLPPRDFGELRDAASGNIAGVAKLLQNWAEDHE